MADLPLKLFNSLSRQLETFTPVHPGEARVYTCGPTVYNYAHLGNMRAYVFADVLGRMLSWRGFALTHVINITDVGHLTDDADAGEDKLEKAATARAQSIWDIARHYTRAFQADARALNCRPPAQWTVATDYVDQMIAFAREIAPRHCYEIESGLYFDVSTVPDYGKLARARGDEGESRIETVAGKRNAADFAIWRRTPPGETRQMEWDSPWGRGAPGWHLECSVMSGAVLGFPFDIHTGGIDHREIHHPNEIAQNQAYQSRGATRCADASGATLWIHNNFLVDRTGKMSKSSGEFLRLQTIIDRGYHPLAYRLLCLQAHYRSELEFSWEGLEAALVRLKRMVLAAAALRDAPPAAPDAAPTAAESQFAAAMADDLNTAVALTALEEVLASRQDDPAARRRAVEGMDAVLGLGLLDLNRPDLRVRPREAALDEAAVEARLAERATARADRDFARADSLRDELAAQGVEVMDGDPLRWEWKLAR